MVARCNHSKVNAHRTNVHGLIINTPVSSGVVFDIVVSHYLNCSNTWREMFTGIFLVHFAEHDMTRSQDQYGSNH